VRWFPLVFLLIAVVAVFILLKRRGASASGNEKGFPYVLGHALFTPAERSFLGALDQAVGTDFRVFGKVRVADIVDVAKGTQKSQRYAAFNRISAKHFDFVLCRPGDLKPVCVIELNDKSHTKDARKGRDEFLEKVCAIAGIPLIFIPAQHSYTVTEIYDHIAGAIGSRAALVTT
jgi:hypothetical protein